MLFEPEIPPNTGNIIRLAANTGSRLHLIEPFGFDLKDKKLRRAGLDYHEFAGIVTYENWANFRNSHGNSRVFGVSTKGGNSYHNMNFEVEDFVVFGPESRGLSSSIRKDIGKDNILRIPMLPNSRSLNLSNAVAVIIYEAWRQQSFIDGF